MKCLFIGIYEKSTISSMLKKITAVLDTLMTQQDLIHQYLSISTPFHSKEWCDKCRSAHNSHTGQWSSTNSTGLETTGNPNTATQAQRPSYLFKFQFFCDQLLLLPLKYFSSISHSTKHSMWKNIYCTCKVEHFSSIIFLCASKFATGPGNPSTKEPNRNPGDFSRAQFLVWQ